MPSMMRRMRTRLPTYLSTGLGALVDISKHSLGSGLQNEAKRKRSMPQAPIPSNPARRVGAECRQFKQRTDWICSRLQGQNANCGVGLSTLDFRLSKFLPTAERNMNRQASASPLRKAAPNHENQGGADDDRAGNVAAARITGRRNRRWQAGIQHAF